MGYKNAVVTINMKQTQVTEEMLSTALKDIDYAYYIFSLEKAETGTFHWQGYIELNKQYRVETLNKLLFNAHLEQRRGTQQQAIDYVRKVGTAYDDGTSQGVIIENGTPKETAQGKRKDLEQIVQLVKEGKQDYEIMLEFPTQYLMFNQHINKLRTMIQAREYQSKYRNVKVIYLWGKSGTGKSSYVRKKHGDNNVYVVNSYNNGAFDGYDGQPVLVLEEYRGDFTIKFLLQLLDIYPLRLPARYTDKIAMFETVYIISNIPFEKQYEYTQEHASETYEALKRRVTIQIELDGTNIDDNHRFIDTTLEKWL